MIDRHAVETAGGNGGGTMAEERQKTADLSDETGRNDKRPDERRKVGERGEKTASRYLEKRGYRILERNWRCRSGEIDIVAAEESQTDGMPTVVFIEVKTRRNLAYGAPSLAVTAEKRRHLLRAAALYRKQHGLENVPARYDVIELLMIDERPYVRHIRNAFS